MKSITSFHPELPRCDDNELPRKGSHLDLCGCTSTTSERKYFAIEIPSRPEKLQNLQALISLAWLGYRSHPNPPPHLHSCRIWACFIPTGKGFYINLEAYHKLMARFHVRVSMRISNLQGMRLRRKQTFTLCGCTKCLRTGNLRRRSIFDATTWPIVFDFPSSQVQEQGHLNIEGCHKVSWGS